MDSILIRNIRAPDDAVLERRAILDEAVAIPSCRTADVVALLRTAAERRLPAPAPERE